MKEITLFPDCIMQVSCPHCQVKGKLRFERPPVKDFLVNCSKCKERFKIKLNIRQHGRKKISVLVSYSLSDISEMGESGSFSGEITDLSETGMAVESSSLWLSDFEDKKGRTLTLVFSLPPKKDMLKVKGVIERIEQSEEKGNFKMGISFFNLDEETGRKIRFFLWN
ncbi:MAG: PilZ domain-containing protein [Pseudomonadota bacterium]